MTLPFSKHEKDKQLSFIQTLTVGFGISPNLLDLNIFRWFVINKINRPLKSKILSARGLYHRWGITPRPENLAK
jgi:hypothetical protein